MQKIRRVLMQFLGNVILIRDEDNASRFYPRFNLMETSSFAAYDASKHHVLRQLHDGYFYKNHMDMWADCARHTIPALMLSTKMLMFGEDLGFVPDCVPHVMQELGVIGLRIQRMPGPEATPGPLLLSETSAGDGLVPGLTTTGWRGHGAVVILAAPSRCASESLKVYAAQGIVMLGRGSALEGSRQVTMADSLCGCSVTCWPAARPEAHALLISPASLLCRARVRQPSQLLVLDGVRPVVP